MFKKNKILNFTTLYRSGNPFKTGAVIADIGFKKTKLVKSIEGFDTKVQKEKIVFQYKLNKPDRVYGLGENLGGVNKRGKRYKLFATDDYRHTQEKESLYGSHPFVIIDGQRTFGLFIDYAGEIIFDVGFTDKDVLTIEIASKIFDLYIFGHKDMTKNVREYLLLTGQPYVPPKWAFGFQQSRWSYPDAKEIKKVAKRFRDEKIPCDAIYLDIDYMDNYKVFTVDKKRFPNFKKFVKKIGKGGFKLIPIIDPGVKIEKGYKVYEEGIKHKTFCAKKNGENYVGAVWPGYVHFPDFLNSKTRKWWASLHRELIESGIEGFWDDMNEPSISYTPDKINGVAKYLKTVDWSDFTREEFVRYQKKVGNIWNLREYLDDLYQRDDSGKLIEHNKVHNLYGSNMALSTSQAFNKFFPNKRYLLLSRSSYAGAHRFTAIWMGDNCSWWEHLLTNIKMLISLNMCGFFYTGADIGGFGCNASPELLIRWMQLGVFSPLYRNHSAIDTRRQEPFAFDKESTDIMRETIKLRYALLPYFYSEFLKSVIKLKPFISPLMFYFKGEKVKEVEDQFMCGDSIMAAPIYTPNAKGRFVHLPEGRWLHWNVSKWDKRDIKIIGAGDHYIEASLNEIPIFIRENTLVPITKPTNYIGEKVIDEITFVGFVTKKAKYILYDDDGVTFNYKKGDVSKIDVEVDRCWYKYNIINNMHTGKSSSCKIKKIKFEIYNEKGTRYLCGAKI